MNYFWLIYSSLSVLALAGSFENGMDAKKAGNFEVAIRELSEAVRVEPKRAEAWLHYGTVLGWQKRYEEALVALEKGLEITPNDFDLRMARARVFAWQRDYGRASNELAKLAEQYPESDDVLVMQGRVANWMGQSSEAEGFYQTVIARNPKQVDALTGLGDLALQRMKSEEAKVFFEQAYAIDPSPDIKQRLDRLENETFRRFDTGLTASSFSGDGKSDWWSMWMQYSRRTAYGTFWGRLEQGERFDESDSIIEIGWEDKVLDHLQSRAFVGISPDAFWAPNWFVETDFLWTPRDEFPGLLAEFRYADYVPRGVFTSRLGFQHEFGKGWVASARWVHQEFEGSQPTDGWILALQKEYDSGIAWNVGVANGAETLDGQALNFATQVLESQTYFCGVRGSWNDDWGWRVDLEYEDYDAGQNRRGISMGIHHKF